jgi:hypothetical protein
MDRQHPRDFFDVHGMYRNLGLTPEIVECFVCYLAGHNRPVHEVLFSRDIDLTPAYNSEFIGMEREPVLLAELQATRARLRRDLIASLTEAQKRFLLGLVAGTPPWELIVLPPSGPASRRTMETAQPRSTEKGESRKVPNANRRTPNRVFNVTRRN